MDIAAEIRKLEKRGVFIYFTYDHYTSGTNCNWSIEFRDSKKQTSWYGDNNVFGDTADAMIAAIRFANWLLEGDNLYWHFLNVSETVTKEGHALWVERSKKQEIEWNFILNQLYTEETRVYYNSLDRV